MEITTTNPTEPAMTEDLLRYLILAYSKNGKVAGDRTARTESGAIATCRDWLASDPKLVEVQAKDMQQGGIGIARALR